MERGSNEHGPRIDDEMKKESGSTTRGAPADSRTDEHRVIEGGSQDAQQMDDTERRSEMAKYVGMEAFPAARDQVIAVARSNGAPRRVIDLLETLPLDRPIENVQDAWESSSH